MLSVISMKQFPRLNGETIELSVKEAKASGLNPFSFNLAGETIELSVKEAKASGLNPFSFNLAGELFHFS
jgi:hypothetical protein